jgi:hypothetical protein
VDDPGQRNRQMTRLVGSLIGRGYEIAVVEEVVLGWWGHFLAEGTIRTTLNQAVAAIRANIKSTLANPNFGRAVGVDHMARCRAISVGEAANTLIEQGVVTPTGLALPGPLSPPCNRVTDHQSLCQTPQDRAFVEAWAVYVAYKRDVLKEDPVKATRDQIRRLIEDRHGLTLDNQQYERLLKKFVTREGRPATRFELAIQTVTGRPGTPSEFVPTGIIHLLPETVPQVAPEAPQLPSIKRTGLGTTPASAA